MITAVDSMAHVPKSVLSDADLYMIKRKLIVIPKASGFSDELPQPIKMYKENDKIIFIPREYFFKYLNLPYEDNTAIGHEMVSILEPIKLDTHRNQPYIAKKIMDHFADSKKNRSMGGIVHAETGCLAGDTVVCLNRCGKGFSTTLDNACIRFKNHPNKLAKNRLYYKDGVVNKIRSFDGENVRLKDFFEVVYSGKKNLWKIRLKNGIEIKATKDHKFLTQIGMVRLEDLNRDKHKLFMDNKNAKKTTGEKKIRSNFISGLYEHPFAGKKNYKHSNRWRVPVHRVAYEASANGMSIEEFKKACTDASKTKDMFFVDPSKYVIHHKNCNHVDNNISNLQLLTKTEHLKLHAKKSYKNFSQGVVESIAIDSIEFFGEDDTYDVTDVNDTHNFVANNIIVSNSGKTVMSLEIARRLGRCTIIFVHKEDLADQWTNRILHFFPNAKIGRVQGDTFDYKDKDFVIVMVQTLVSRYDNFLLNKEFRNYFGTLIVDECLDENSIIAVPGGHKLLKDIVIGDEVITPTGIARVKDKWVTEKEAIKYITAKGSEIIASEEHIVSSLVSRSAQWKIKSCDRVDIKIKDAKNIQVFNSELLRERNVEHEFIGWFVADGTMESGCVKFAFRKQEKVDALSKVLSDCGIKYNISKNYRDDIIISCGRSGGRIVESYGFINGKKTSSVKVPEDIYNSCSVSFLSGLFSGDGTFNQDRIEIQSASKSLIKMAGEMLRSLGIPCTVKTFKTTNNMHSDRHRICLFGMSIQKFIKCIGFSVLSKRQKAENYLAMVNPIRGIHKDDIISKESVGIRKLIDISLDDKDNLFIANGFVVHNCHKFGSKEWGKTADIFHARYRLGVTATPRRKDKCENVFKYHIGDIVVHSEGYVLEPIIYFKETGYRTYGNFDINKFPPSTQLSIVSKNKNRNMLIANYLVKAALAGRKIIVFSKFIEHLQTLEGFTRSVLLAQNMDKTTGFYVGELYTGQVRLDKKNKKVKVKAKQSQDDLLRAAGSDIIFASYKKAEDALDIEDLDTLVMALPIADPIQVCGRILRLKDGKAQPIVVDICDASVGFFENIKESRIKHYKKKKWSMKIAK